ncbi:hypothetical protein ACSBR1_023061 [Camellia fascicularis]
MADDLPHDGVPSELPLVDFEVDFEAEPEPLPLSIRPFDSARGSGTTIAWDWYSELPARVRDIVDKAGFGLFCSSLTRVVASCLLLGALVER